jgi:ApaG protein
MIPYQATTRDIQVTVRPVYLDGQSDVLGKRFAFGYFVRIQNHGPEDIQLLRRHWYITDSDGRVQEVEGEGVIGKKPVIAPGESHEYNSYCVLETFVGHMKGTYTMETMLGERFKVEIPRFDLKAGVN